MPTDWGQGRRVGIRASCWGLDRREGLHSKNIHTRTARIDDLEATPVDPIRSWLPLAVEATGQRTSYWASIFDTWGLTGHLPDVKVNVRGGTRQSTWEILLMCPNQRGPHVSLKLHLVSRCLRFWSMGPDLYDPVCPWLRLGAYKLQLFLQNAKTGVFLCAFTEQKLIRPGPMHRRF